jgi:hypothetical protein
MNERQLKTVTCKTCYYQQRTATKESHKIGTQDGLNSYSRQLKIPTESVAPLQGLSCFRNVAPCVYPEDGRGKKIHQQLSAHSHQTERRHIPDDSRLNCHKRENFEPLPARLSACPFSSLCLVRQELNYTVILMMSQLL